MALAPWIWVSSMSSSQKKKLEDLGCRGAFGIEREVCLGERKGGTLRIKRQLDGNKCSVADGPTNGQVSMRRG